MAWYTIAALVVAAALLAGFTLQVLGERRDARRWPPPGRLVGAPGRRMHVRVVGSAPGPTVVIEQGAGGFGALWWGVQDSIAEFATVLTYDRLGLGYSDPAPEPYSVADRVTDLRELLAAVGARPPYVLVAHSYGGLLVRRFAREYPRETAGLVLVDTVEEGIHFHPNVAKLYRRLGWLLRVLIGAYTVGLPRAWRVVFPDREAAKDDRHAAIAALMMRPQAFRGMRMDSRSLTALPAAERESWPPAIFGSLPLCVITHGQRFPGPLAMLEEHWPAGQQRLAALSTQSELVVAQHSNHMIQEDEPQVVVDAIRRVLSRARSS